MYTIDDLNVKLLSELKDIADQMGIKNARKLGKQELVYKILDEQAVKGDDKPARKEESAPANNNNNNERRMRPRRRENVAPSEEHSKPKNTPVKHEKADKSEKADMSTEDLIQSMDLDLEGSMPRFDEESNAPSFENNKQEEGQNEQETNRAPQQQQPQRHGNIKDFDGVIASEGVLEIMQDGYGFLRSSD